MKKQKKEIEKLDERIALLKFAYQNVPYLQLLLNGLSSDNTLFLILKNNVPALNSTILVTTEENLEVWFGQPVLFLNNIFEGETTREIQGEILAKEHSLNKKKIYLEQKVAFEESLRAQNFFFVLWIFFCFVLNLML